MKLQRTVATKVFAWLAPVVLILGGVLATNQNKMASTLFVLFFCVWGMSDVMKNLRELVERVMFGPEEKDPK